MKAATNRALRAVAILTFVTSCAARQQGSGGRAERKQTTEAKEQATQSESAGGRAAAWQTPGDNEQAKDPPLLEPGRDRAASAPQADPADERAARTPPPGPGIEGSYGEHVSHSRELIAELRSNSWAEACLNAASALDALSRALAKSGQSGRAVQQSARKVWHEANELRDACGGSFDAADRMKAGLDSALDGLEKALSQQDGAQLEPWLGAARTAVDDLERSSSWVFQRARVQDAFRTVSDAFVALGQLEGAGDLTPSRAEGSQAAAQAEIDGNAQ